MTISCICDQGGGCESGHGGNEIDSNLNYMGGCSGFNVGGETGSGEDGNGDRVMDTNESSAGGGGSGFAHTRGTGSAVVRAGQVLLPLLLLNTSLLR